MNVSFRKSMMFEEVLENIFLVYEGPVKIFLTNSVIFCKDVLEKNSSRVPVLFFFFFCKEVFGVTFSIVSRFQVLGT